MFAPQSSEPSRSPADPDPDGPGLSSACRHQALELMAGKPRPPKTPKPLNVEYILYSYMGYITYSGTCSEGARPPSPRPRRQHCLNMESLENS